MKFLKFYLLTNLRIMSLDGMLVNHLKGSRGLGW